MTTTVLPCTGDVTITASGPSIPTVHGSQPVWETNDGATSYVEYPTGFIGVSEDPTATIDTAGFAGPFTLYARVAADWTGHDLAWGYVELAQDPGVNLARTTFLSGDFDGFTEPGWVEVDYPMDLLTSAEAVRAALAGPCKMRVQRQVGGTPEGDGTYTFDVTYVALVIVYSAPHGRQYPRDDFGRRWPHPRSVQSGGRTGWNGGYFAHSGFGRRESRRCR